jgi:DMSO/TMAO reductase YedYZ molybdopterin-dependent catalytic subunit
MSDQPPQDDDIQRRIVEARLRLRARFLDKIQQTPALADPQPLGDGPPNRHGMPQIPVGQTPTAPGKWPVLDLGTHPIVPLDKWSLSVDGECRAPVTLDWNAFMRLEQVEDVSDFHCVTGWSRLDVPWSGVRFATVVALVEPTDAAEYVVCHSFDGYTTNLPLSGALKDDVLLVHAADGAALPREHGGPVRVITPQLYAWKGAKWIERIELMRQDQLGFWEQRGYSNSAHPWRNDRYAR